MSAPVDPSDDPSSQGETQRLARAYRDGGSPRFDELYARIAPALFTWAKLRVRPAMRGFVDPEDVVQEVWCRACKGFAAFDADSASFRPWIFRIAKNVLLEAFRKHQSLASMPGGAGASTRLFQLQNLPDSATNISHRLARDEGIRQLLAWVESLDEDEQKLFVHCGLEGLSYAEVSERLQVERDTIAKRWQKLRDRIAQFGVSKDLLADE